jgi:hypothetical protein
MYMLYTIRKKLYSVPLQSFSSLHEHEVNLEANISVYEMYMYKDKDN